MRTHYYKTLVKWTGNKGSGTDDYRNYERSHEIHIEGKPVIMGSSDVAFRGDKTRHNPEDMLLSSLSTCHMLWYLHLCADAGVVVVNYSDEAEGVMEETAGGGGRFTSVTLHPTVVVVNTSMKDKALALHERANELCFIANSVNFKVQHKAVISVAS